MNIGFEGHPNKLLDLAKIIYISYDHLAIKVGLYEELFIF